MTLDPEGGLDLRRLDALTDQERSAFSDFYAEHKGRTLPGHEFWLRHDVGALKRYRKYAIEMNHEEARAHPQVAVLCWLHYYAVIGFEEGISYQIHNVRQRGGSPREDILATLQTAFLHSGPLGSRFVGRVADLAMDEDIESTPVPWPAGWRVEPGAIGSGLDETTQELTEAEAESTRAWYLKWHGEIPAWVELWIRYNPAALKAYRMRYEHAADAGLPLQMFALLLLQWEITRGDSDAIRDAFAFARGAGVSRPYAFDAVSRAAIYTGPSIGSVVLRSAGDIIDSLTP